jgi:ribosomal protein S18 acetylase RimI-like enzyme
MSAITIQTVAAEQLPALQQIAQKTFSETFSASNSAADMANYLASQLSAAQLLRELHQSGSSFYFALWEGEVIGYLKLNTAGAQSHPEAINALEIERIYVLQAFQGKQIGQSLLEKALSEARALQAPYLWLGVWEHNERAIRFYQKQGFEVYGSHVFQLGRDAQTDLLMRRTLAY